MLGYPWESPLVFCTNKLFDLPSYKDGNSGC